MPGTALLVLSLLGVRQPHAAADVRSESAATQKQRPPQLSRLTPRFTTLAALAAGGTIWVDVHGRRFDAAHNSVSFGPVTLTDVVSRDRGTHLRFAVPTEFRSSGEVPPQRVGAGSYQIRVTTPLGTSNALTFTITAGS